MASSKPSNKGPLALVRFGSAGTPPQPFCQASATCRNSPPGLLLAELAGKLQPPPAGGCVQRPGWVGRRDPQCLGRPVAAHPYPLSGRVHPGVLAPPTWQVALRKGPRAPRRPSQLSPGTGAAPRQHPAQRLAPREERGPMGAAPRGEAGSRPVITSVGSVINPTFSVIKGGV
ncbi:MAG: hypothetical protein EOO60_00820 [Hymenobacter sp.]|nr:MAG: hypothetical protein EOO60_00820 [Hymenobacter sp.]